MMGFGYNISLLGILASLFLRLDTTKAVPSEFLVLFVRVEHELQNDMRTMKDSLNQFPVRNLNEEQQHIQQNINRKMPGTGCPYTSGDAFDLLHGIDKMVNSFYVKNAEKIVNGDGGLGLVVLHEQLNYLLDIQEKKLSTEMKEFLGKLMKSSGLLSNQILDQTEMTTSQSDPIISNGIKITQQNMGALRGNPAWHDFSAITKHFTEFKNIGNEQEVIEPSLNFKCLTSLMDGCKDSQLCKAAYTHDIYSQYMLTHQVLYQHISEQRSCPSGNARATVTESAQKYRDRLCSKVYLEAEYLEAHNFPTRFIDLFAEQVATCGLMGYPNFMRGDWLQEILSWMGDSTSPTITGCIPNWYGSEETTDTIVRVQKVNLKTGVSEGECECLVHLTTVSLMALSVNLRYMVDACEPGLFEGFFQVDN